MPRYRLTVEYDGGPFVGWQHQAIGASVQGTLAQAAAQLAGHPVEPMAAGRTDAGVHALGQVVHIDLQKDLPAETVANALNAHLRPAPIAVLDAALAPPGFHARFSATGRHYRYRILNRPAPAAVDAGRVWHIPWRLDAGAMAAAAATLLGWHDFSTFRAAACQAKSPMKTLDRLDVLRRGEEIEVLASARSFLHNQVRAMVGTLSMVGAGRWTMQDFAAAFAARDRQAGGPNAPAGGLYLIAVDYGARTDAEGQGAEEAEDETGE